MFKDDDVRIKHMIDASYDAISFAKDKQRSDLDKDRMLVLSLVKAIEIIGEAANKISNNFKAKYPNIRWHSIVGMRNRLIHAYFDVNHDTVWDTVKNEIPKLVAELEKIVKG